MFEQADANRAVIDEIVDAGAFIMGRNMFAPGRGDWDLDWKGWWGDDPPYHGPVFVLTHHPREPLTMDGGTTFTFVTDGIESAFEQARRAAGDRNISIAGGAETVRQYLAAGLIDELNLHIAPILLGAGEPLFAGLDGTQARAGRRHARDPRAPIASVAEREHGGDDRPTAGGAAHGQRPAGRLGAVAQAEDAGAALGSAPPRPSSETSQRSTSPSSRTDTTAVLACACLSTLVSASETM